MILFFIAAVAEESGFGFDHLPSVCNLVCIQEKEFRPDLNPPVDVPRVSKTGNSSLYVAKRISDPNNKRLGAFFNSNPIFRSYQKRSDEGFRCIRCTIGEWEVKGEACRPCVLNSLR